MNQYVFLTCIEGIDTRGGAGNGIQVIPATPTSLTATADADSINLAWTRVGTYDKVLIDRKDIGDYTQIASIASAASYDDTTALPGITYTYRVRGLRNGYPSPYSNESSATISAGAVKASGTFTIPDYTIVSGTTVTVDSVGLTEGLDWFAAVSNDATATSLSAAINANVDPGTATAGHATNVVTVTATVAGSAGNSIQFSGGPGVTASPNSGTLGGGSD